MEFLQKVALIAAGSIALGIAVGDLFGFVDRFQWISRRIPKITLALLGILVISSGFRSDNDLEDMRNQIKVSEAQIVDKLSESRSVDVLQFESPTEVYGHVASKLRIANHSVDDITWGARLSYRTAAEEAAYNDYLKSMEEASQRITYREISGLVNEHYFQRAVNLIGYVNYYLGYYDMSQVASLSFPLLLLIHQR